MNNLVIVNVSEPDYAGKLTHEKLKLTGQVDLGVLNTLKRHEYDYLDISEVEFGIDEEKWYVCLGWSHCGPVYGNSGWREVEVLKRFLEEINAKTILLPDNVQRRHINSAKKNPHIKELQVSPNSPLFAYEDGKLMNKKKTKPVFNCKAYTVIGEIRGEWHTSHPTVEILLNDFLNDYFGNLAWKQVVKDGMDYYNLSRREAENAEMTGDEYTCFIPEEFKSDDLDRKN